MVVKSDVTVVVRVVGTVTVSVRSWPVVVDTMDSVVVNVPAVTVVVDAMAPGSEVGAGAGEGSVSVGGGELSPPGMVVVMLLMGSGSVAVVDSEGIRERVPSWAFSVF